MSHPLITCADALEKMFGSPVGKHLLERIMSTFPSLVPQIYLNINNRLTLLLFQIEFVVKMLKLQLEP